MSEYKSLDELAGALQGVLSDGKVLDAARLRGELTDRLSPPQKAGDEVKLLYASQIGTAPPEFAIVSNRPLDIHESYLRYLQRGFREAWSFNGSPLRIKFTSRGGRR